jgi:AcrR family transcriptional regulator
VAASKTGTSKTGTGARTDGGKRTYASPLRARRAAETKEQLIRTATDLFLARGWAGTGVRDVAREAGVAVETLYSHYASKRKLFDAVVDQAVVGDDAPIAVAERPEFLALAEGSRPDRIAAAASLITSIHERTAPFARLIREAATSDAEIAGVLHDTRERQRADIAAGLALILGRPPTVAERDGVWAILALEVHDLLRRESGWSRDDYEQWVSETLARLLPRR